MNTLWNHIKQANHPVKAQYTATKFKPQNIDPYKDIQAKSKQKLHIIIALYNYESFTIIALKSRVYNILYPPCIPLRRNNQD